MTHSSNFEASRGCCCYVSLVDNWCSFHSDVSHSIFSSSSSAAATDDFFVGLQARREAHCTQNLKPDDPSVEVDRLLSDPATGLDSIENYPTSSSYSTLLLTLNRHRALPSNGCSRWVVMFSHQRDHGYHVSSTHLEMLVFFQTAKF